MVNNKEFFVLYIENKVTRLQCFTSQLLVEMSFKLIQYMWLWKPSEIRSVPNITAMVQSYLNLFRDMLMALKKAGLESRFISKQK